jgi:hypothetical protein
MIERSFDQQRRGHRIVNQRGWPGRRGYRPPPALTTPERLRDRVALVLTVLPEPYTVSERLGLGAYLLVHGNLVLDAGIIVESGLAERHPSAYRSVVEWARQHPVHTAAGLRAPRRGAGEPHQRTR